VNQASALEQDGPLAQPFDHRRVVRDEKQRDSPGDELVDHPGAFELESRVPDGERLIDDQDVRVDVGGHRKSQPQHHAAGVRLDRLLHEIADLRKRGDGLEASGDLPPAEPEHGAVEEDVLPPGKIGVEAGAQFQQRGHPSSHLQ